MAVTISTVEDLQALMNMDTGYEWNLDYVQTADIDASSLANPQPIGNGTTNFSGTYDGQGHTISNLTINMPSTDKVGLFGYTAGSSVEISGLILTDCNITGQNFTACLVGRNNATITNCLVSGNVAGNNYTGSLIGHHSISLVSKSCCNCSVSGVYCVGGLLGYLYSGTIQNCYVNGTLSGSSSNIGGLVGKQYTTATVLDCYTTMQITQYSDISTTGTFVGILGDEITTPIIQDCRALSQSGLNFVGRNDGTITNCDAVSLSELTKQSTYEAHNFDFNDTWGMDDFAVLQWEFTMGIQYYVNDSTGDDANDGLSVSSPKKTLQAMINAITGDCTINVAAGTYTGNSYYHLSTNQSGYNIVIQGDGSDTTSLVMSNATVGFWLDSNFVSGSITFRKLKLLWTSTDAAGGKNGIIRVNTTGTSGDKISVIIGEDAVIGDKYTGSTQRGINFANITDGQYRDLVLRDGAIINATEYGVYIDGCGDLTVKYGATVNSDSDAFFIYDTIDNIDINMLTINSEAAGIPINSACTVGTLRLLNSQINIKSGSGVSIVGPATFVYIDNNTLVSNSTSGASKLINVGTDAETASATVNFAYIGRNNCSFTGSSISHGMLIGDGVDGAIVEYNTVTGGDYSFVLKADNCDIHHNYFESSDTAAALIKHGAYNNFHHNTCVGTSNANALIWKPEGSTNPTGNMITNNVFQTETNYIITNGAYTDTWDCLLDYNDYYCFGSSFSYVNNTAQSSISELQQLWYNLGGTKRFNDFNSINVNPNISRQKIKNKTVLESGLSIDDKGSPMGSVSLSGLQPISRIRTRYQNVNYGIKL